MNSTEIHPDDKKSLCEYACLIGENHDVINISVSFKKLGETPNERIQFIINGKLSIKDSIDEAICFLDGIMTALDIIALQAE